MTSIVYKKSYNEPPFDKREALRYAGVRGDAPDIESRLDECISEARAALSYNVCYKEMSVDELISYLGVSSRTVDERLFGCDGVIVMAATVGFLLDRLIGRYSRLEPTRALLLGAVGAERIEALCDVFCDDMSREHEGALLGARFSPGYGDFPLSAQRKIFSLLECERRIGLSLNESLVMSPSKSVTALIGIKRG